MYYLTILDGKQLIVAIGIIHLNVNLNITVAYLKQKKKI